MYDISTHILTKRMTIQRKGIVPHRFISTHILTKRMTSGCLYILAYMYFNSHPHEEDDSNFKQK